MRSARVAESVMPSSCCPFLNLARKLRGVLGRIRPLCQKHLSVLGAVVTPALGGARIWWSWHIRDGRKRKNFSGSIKVLKRLDQGGNRLPTVRPLSVSFLFEFTRQRGRLLQRNAFAFGDTYDDALPLFSALLVMRADDLAGCTERRPNRLN